MIHRKKHPEFVPGCQPCKWSSISFGTVPGGARDGRTGFSKIRQRENDLHRYREKRRAGERPDGTTKEAMDRHDRRLGSLEKVEPRLRDDNPPEVAQRVIDRTQNKR